MRASIERLNAFFCNIPENKLDEVKNISLDWKYIEDSEDSSELCPIINIEFYENTKLNRQE